MKKETVLYIELRKARDDRKEIQQAVKMVEEQLARLEELFNRILAKKRVERE